MIKIKYTIRTLCANKQNTVFSLIGMTVGITSFAIIAIWLYSHWTFDRFHKEADQLYFIQNTDTTFGNSDIVNPYPLAEAIRATIPQMKHTSTVLMWADKYKLTVEKNQFFEEITPVEKEILEILDFSIIDQKQDIFSHPTDIIINKSIAIKLFGSTSCIGENIIINDSIIAEVSAVFQDFPKNSSFDFKILTQFEIDPSQFQFCTGWNNYCYATISKIEKGADITQLSKQIDKIVYEAKEDKNDIFSLYPLTSYHLKPLNGEDKSKHLLMIFLSGLLVLLISIINFINLQTTTLYKRNKESSIKKILGATNHSIISESLLETALYILISLVASLGISALVIPYISEIIYLDIKSIVGIKGIIIIEFVSALIIYFLITIYLSLIITRKAFNKISLIEKSKISNLNRVSKLLIIFQFAFTIFILISSTIMRKQLNYAVNSDKGFEVENIIAIESWDYPFKENRAAITDYLSQNNNIVSYSIVERAFNNLGSRTTGFSNPDWNEEKNNFYKVMYHCDENLLKTTGIKIIEGRFLTPHSVNPNNIVINETFAKRLGGKDKVIGKNLLNGSKTYIIIGVCNDFRFNTYYTNIEPLVILYNNNWSCNLLIKTRSGKDVETAQEVTNFMQSKSKAPFKVSTMKTLLSDLYKEENRQNQLLSIFGFLTILISCLGLFGLSIFIVENRTIEIGIRKANGATVGQIIWLINRGFLKWIIYANIVAAPIAYIIMRKWLQNFVYKINLSLWIFLIIGIFAIFLSLITVSWQSWRAATRNPVDSLRDE